MRSLALALTLLTGASAFAVDGITKDEIIIASINGKSGPTAPYGNGMSTGAEALYKRINAAGGVHGRKINYTSFDDGYEPEKALKIMGEIEKKKVFAIVGSNGTPSINATLPAMKSLGLPLVFPYSGGSVIYAKENTPHVFAMRVSYAQEAEMMVDYAVKDLKIKEIGVFYQDDAFGTSGKNGVGKALDKYNLTIKGMGTYARNTTDVSGGVAALLKEKPQAIYVQATTPIVVELVKKCHEKNYHPVFMGPSILGSREVANLLGSIKADVYISEVVPLPTETSIPLVKQYNEDMKALGKTPEMGAVAMEGYLAAAGFVEAMKMAGPEPTREKLKAAIEKMGGKDIMGIQLGFSPTNHTGMKTAYIYNIKNGQLNIASK